MPSHRAGATQRVRGTAWVPSCRAGKGAETARGSRHQVFLMFSNASLFILASKKNRVRVGYEKDGFCMWVGFGCENYHLKTSTWASLVPDLSKLPGQEGRYFIVHHLAR